MTTAIFIVTQMDDVAEAITQGSITLKCGCETIQALREIARKLGLEAEVDRIIQEASKEEFTEACKASGIAL